MRGHQIHTITGAFGFSGKYIARRLLQKGYTVKTLPHSVERKNPFGSEIEVHPYHFENPKELTRSLKGTRVLYNTYRVRFNADTFDFATALENTRILFDSANWFMTWSSQGMK